MLYDHLSAKGVPAVFFREPGSTFISEKIRAILLDRQHEKMTAPAELLLYSAARTQMVSEEILPSLETGKVVICDRFYDSTTAYQGHGREIDLDFVNRLNTFVTYATRPNLTFLIDLDPETALTRNKNNGGTLDRLEQEKAEFHHRVRDGYLALASSSDERDRFLILDGKKPIEAIHQEVLAAIKQRLDLS